MQTIEEYKAYTKQLENEVGKWHRAYDALMVERNQHRSDFSKAWGAMVACYRAIDRHFGNEIRAQLEKNDRTQKEGQMRALMEQMQKLTK